MLSGYQRTTPSEFEKVWTGLDGLGCGLDSQCGCDRGMGDLWDPSTWGPADWLIAGLAGWIGWKWLTYSDQRHYARQVRRRLGVD